MKFATLRRVAPAQTLPRGERGPRLATDLQPRPVPQSTPPKPKPASAGFVFQKTEYWDQLPSLSSELKREDATAHFLRRGFPYGVSRGIPCSAYTAKYPIPASGLPTLRLSTPSDRNVRSAPENIVRMERGKTVTHYNTGLSAASLYQQRLIASPPSPDTGQRDLRVLSILVYHQPAVNDNYRLCRDWWELAEFTVGSPVKLSR